MKKLVIALLALAVSFSAMAQQPGQNRGGKDHERFEAEKVAYITQQLALTVEEAQVFWPIYNKAQEEHRAEFKAVREKKKALHDALKEGKSDAEIKPLLDAYLKARKEVKDPMVEHRKDFVKAIGEVKTAKLYLSEEGFRNKSLRQMAGGRKGPGQRNAAPGEAGKGKKPSGK